MRSQGNKVMQDLKVILDKKRFNVSSEPQKINPKWEEAVQFWEYLGIKPNRGDVVFVLGLCKKYQQAKVYGLQSFLKDASYDRSRLKGLMVWKLKGGFDAQNCPTIKRE